jgi:glycerol-3-phosphate dehydrogenase
MASQSLSSSAATSPRGTSGRTHGLLHSGGRYCVGDRESAIECVEENGILRRIAAQCIEPNGGLFIAQDERDLAYAQAFEQGAAACRIPNRAAHA